jgi:hypothetical protein
VEEESIGRISYNVQQKSLVLRDFYDDMSESRRLLLLQLGTSSESHPLTPFFLSVSRHISYVHGIEKDYHHHHHPHMVESA